MRQSGVLCAAALIALHKNVGKLEDDHKKAKVLAGISCFNNRSYIVSQAMLYLVYSHCTNFPSCRWTE